ncbi:MAG: M20 family metallopeptidase [Gemmataceae bacterium]|nr:M20 family metallopeptidase [Gemmataceae bacterium]MCI0741428.1 M20 family metallopeptidase [Gemmataceae bacterium]
MNEATRLARDLVRLPSVNPMGRNLPEDITLEHRVTAYLDDFFRGLGVSYQRQSVAPKRDNIVARWDNPGARRTIVFEAHQDTVPTDNMTIDPFGGVIEGNRLFGRGACDIKGGMAAMLAAFARLVRDKPRGAASVIMACTVDEEHMFEGVQHLVKSGLKADMAIAAEPTDLNIVHAHKGAVRWHLTALGRSCHSSAPEKGSNAIYGMARLLAAIERYAGQLRQYRIDPLLGPATLSVGLIDGGASPNTVPDRCTIVIDRRLVRGEDPVEATSDLKRHLQKEAGDVAFEGPTSWMAKETLDPEGSEEVTALLGQAIDAVRGSHKVEAVPYGTDASTMAVAGIPSVVFGPGAIDKAHTADEWLPLDELEQAVEILYRFACAEPR